MSQRNNKGLLLRIRKSRAFKGLAVCLSLNLLAQMVQPTVSLALTEGPSQPEVQSFEPIGTTQMVDMFTGDFNYNIPLFNLPGPNGGYPVNLAYHAGVTMDDEASWVGLGWNINAGALVRNMRGLPDEFLSDGTSATESSDEADYLEIKSDQKASWTLGVNGFYSQEFIGASPNGGVPQTTSSTSLDMNMGLSVYYNNFRGFGIRPNFGMGLGKNSPFSMGISLDSESGLGLTASVSNTTFKDLKRNRQKFSLSLDFSGELAIGTALNFSSASAAYTEDGSVVYKSDGQGGGSSSMTFASPNFIPSIGHESISSSISGSISFGFSTIPMTQQQAGGGIEFSKQSFSDLDRNGRRLYVAGYNNMDKAGDRHTRDYMRYNDGQIIKGAVALAKSNYTFDTYTMYGQGMGGFFRPKRNDIGRVFDPYTYSSTNGISFGITFGSGSSTEPELSDLGTTFGYSYQGPWNDKNVYDDEFTESTPDGIEENLYYQMHGEHAITLSSDLSYLEGLSMTNVKLGDWDGGKRTVDNVNFSEANHPASNRFVRNSTIHTLKNHEVGNLGEFDIHYFPSTGDIFDETTTTNLNRSTRYGKSSDGSTSVSIENHNAGFKVLNEQGSYYVYGLPAYNHVDIKNTFSVNRNNLTSTGENVSYHVDNGEVDYKLKHNSNGLTVKYNSNKFIDKKITSPYAHSYMLTSIQGADYVDVTNNGPSDDDLGYWVKFDYQKVADDYQWRSPYKVGEAQFYEGDAYHSDDDAGSYGYGEKELWYLARMETKSHVAIFMTVGRNDNKDAKGELSTTGSDHHGKRLKEIRVYDKASFMNSGDPENDLEPLQTVHFEYSYDLCYGPDNYDSGGTEPENVSGQNGKLTLKRIWFTSLGSERGVNNAYVFDYAGVNLSGTGSPNDGINPAFKANSYDGWGGFKPRSDSYEYDSRFAYVNQFNQSWGGDTWNPGIGYLGTHENENQVTKDYTQQLQDDYASAWCLNRIKLPSGGVININYESDDYGYVQHKTANQMFRIVRMGYPDFSTPGELYEESDGDNDFWDLNSLHDDGRRKIYFKLEEPIDASLSESDQANEVYERYVEPIIQDENGDRNLYFKSKMKLTHPSPTDGVWDYVSGYLKLAENSSQSIQGEGTNYNYGVHTSSTLDGNSSAYTEGSTTYYTIGYVTVMPAKKRNGNYFDQYHPMSEAAWTYMQTNTPELLFNPNSFDSDEDIDEWNFLGKTADLFSIIPQLKQTFGAIRSYCQNKSMGRFIDLERSCIRLASPDKKKFGGGHRVKQISISDSWSPNTGQTEDTYGQVFNYTIEEDGRTISSGVAQYEPQAIGDENALKYPIHFVGKTSTFGRNNLFSEMPLNEALYPGPSVGYRKVEVQSLNTRDAVKSYEDNNNSGDYGRTGGITVHEFYTAKEFPTMEDHTILSKDEKTSSFFNVPIPIPFIGSINREYFHGTQSFLIETNDMHGKPKATRTYEINNYVSNPKAITESEYEYQCNPIMYQGESVFKLDNMIDAIESDNPTLNITQDYGYIGVSVDLFTDQREMKSFSQQIGVDLGVQFSTTFPLAFLPEIWPSFNNSKSLFRTYVTNKVVHRSGIIKKSRTRDLQTVNESEILAYDEKSGIPILTRVTNEFGDDFYNYSVPAYYHYENMGHAYRNINYNFEVSTEFDVTDAQGNPITQGDICVDLTATPSMIAHLVRGDELLIESAGSAQTNQYKKAYFLGWIYSGQNKTKARVQILDAQEQATAETYRFRVIRSGRRNHFSATAANYATKGALTTSGTESVTVINGHTITTDKIAAKTALQASAKLYKDTWNGTNDLRDNTEKVFLQDAVIENPYLTGNAGIWRPYKAYSFVGEREANASMDDNSTADPDLKNDGLFTDEVPIFTWEIGDLEDYSNVSGWEWMNEVTRFSSDSYETENVNRLGIHSSALYGYDNSLSIAVGGNSSYYELGAMDFETSKDNWLHGASMIQTNMNFNDANNQDLGYIFQTEVLPIKEAVFNGTDLVVTTKIPYADFDASNYEGAVRLTLNSTETSTFEGNESLYLNGDADFSTISNAGGMAQFEVNTFYCESTETVLPISGYYTGKVRVLIRRPVLTNQSQSSKVEFTEGKAHTGAKSMMLTSTALFDQPMLKVIKNKSYVVSLWISRDEKARTYQTGSPVSVGRIVSNAFSSNDVTIENTTYSKVIEGWQKVDIEFFIGVENAILALQFQPGASALYVDDVRFSPRTGGITTHVYDPNRFWLRASLNVDNYATLFFYDEEGNLTMKKQETEEGIFTITESRGHVYED